MGRTLVLLLLLLLVVVVVVIVIRCVDCIGRCLVFGLLLFVNFPDEILRRVEYLDRPWKTFRATIASQAREAHVSLWKDES